MSSCHPRARSDTSNSCDSLSSTSSEEYDPSSFSFVLNEQHHLTVLKLEAPAVVSSCNQRARSDTMNSCDSLSSTSSEAYDPTSFSYVLNEEHHLDILKLETPAMAIEAPTGASCKCKGCGHIKSESGECGCWGF